MQHNIIDPEGILEKALKWTKEKFAKEG